MKRFPRIEKRILVAALALILALGSGAGADADDLRPATTYQLADWSEIWTFIDEYYIYPDFRGVDWKAQKAAVEAKIKAGLDDASFTALVDKTLALLKDPRTYYLSPEKLRSQLAISGGEGTTGVGLFLIKGKGSYAVVASVVPGGSADEAGIASHDRILAIDGKPPLDAYGEPDLYRVRGAPGSSLRLRVSHAGGAAKEITLSRRAVAPEGGAINSRMIEGTGSRRIGYIFLA
ncbi:MAG: PDZ domain-containing protein, partial [Spirochaetaceae bacterium]|nr:PDZ domain-containing protein [Spirochaetaceae bacterium]